MDQIPDLNLPTVVRNGFGIARTVPVLARPYRSLLDAIERDGIGMSEWHKGDRGKTNISAQHFCATVHCLAGHTTHLCGKQGYDLEIQTGCPSAAALILNASSGFPVPPFFPSDYYTDEEEEDGIEPGDEEINRRVINRLRCLAAEEDRHYSQGATA